MEVTFFIYCIIAGLFAGVLNTLAGSGSVITLALLSLMGLPINVANGTNRVGIFLQSAASSYKFYKQDELHLKGNWWLLFCTTIGAFGGIYAAGILDVNDFETVVGCVFVLLFFVVLLKPQNHVKQLSKFKKVLPLVFVLIGFYAGFIQAGAGVFMLVLMHVAWGGEFTALNPLKVFIVLLINAAALVGYIFFDQINWSIGLSLGIGQLFGGILGVKLNNLKKNIEPYIRVLLLGLILASIVNFFNIY